MLPIEDLNPPETPLRLCHCKTCCAEDMYTEALEWFGEPQSTCYGCGGKLHAGELEPGACSVCGIIRDSGQVALANWHTEDGPEDLLCGGCVEESK